MLQIKTFFFYSILGFLLESSVYKIMGSTRHSGVFYGPITIVYGFGALLILAIDHFFLKKLKMNAFLKGCMAFVLFTVGLSFIEWIGGIGISFFFHLDLWDYSSQVGAIGKYISIPMALTWGAFSLLFLYVIHPFMKKIIKKIPKMVTYFMIVLLVIDLIFTIITGTWKTK